jgi:hypothetical protein
MEFLGASWYFVRGVRYFLNVSSGMMARFSGDETQ